MAISNEGPQTIRSGIGKRWTTRQELLDPQDRSGRRARSVVKRSCSQQEFPAVDISRGSDSSSTVCDAKWRQLVDSTQGDASRREILVSRRLSQIAENRSCY